MLTLSRSWNQNPSNWRKSVEWESSTELVLLNHLNCFLNAPRPDEWVQTHSQECYSSTNWPSLHALGFLVLSAFVLWLLLSLTQVVLVLTAQIVSFLVGMVPPGMIVRCANSVLVILTIRLLRICARWSQWLCTLLWLTLRDNLAAIMPWCLCLTLLSLGMSGVWVNHIPSTGDALRRLLSPILQPYLTECYQMFTVSHCSYALSMDPLHKSVLDLCWCGPRMTELQSLSFWSVSIPAQFQAYWFLVLAISESTFASMVNYSAILATLSVFTLPWIWQGLRAVHLGLWSLFVPTEYRSSFNVAVPATGDLRHLLTSYLKSARESAEFDTDESNPHCTLARDRKLAVNAAAYVLRLRHHRRVYDVCGIASRLVKALKSHVTLVSPRDTINYNAYLKGDAIADNEWVEPRQEIKAYDGPVILSLADWYYYKEELAKIFCNHGGIVVTIPFEVDGQRHVLSPTGRMDEADYVAGAAGVIFRAEGGAVYTHGYHEWADGAQIATQAGILQANFLADVGHLRLYHIKPVSGTAIDERNLRSISIGRPVDLNGTLAHMGGPNYTWVTPQRTFVLDPNCVTIAAQSLIGAETDEGVRRLLRLHLVSKQSKDSLQAWSQLAEEHLSAARHYALILQPVVPWWRKWFVQWTQFVKASYPVQAARRVFKNVVFANPELQPMAEGDLVPDLTHLEVKQLSPSPRPAPDATSGDRMGPLPGDGGSGGRGDQRSGKFAQPGDQPKNPSPAEVDGAGVGPAQARDRLCFNCRGTGHIARECPKPRTDPPPRPSGKRDVAGAPEPLRREGSELIFDARKDQFVSGTHAAKVVRGLGDKIPDGNSAPTSHDSTQGPAQKNPDAVLHQSGASRKEGPKEHLPAAKRSGKQAGASGVQDGKDPKRAAKPVQGPHHPRKGPEAPKPAGGGAPRD